MFFLLILSIKIEVHEGNTDEIFKMSETTPVLLMLYSPYCGHCKEVHPKWEELGTKYEKDDKIVIAESNYINHKDATFRMWPTLNSVPTFVYFVNHKGTQFKPTRTIESFINIVEEFKQVQIGYNYSLYTVKSYPSCIFYPSNGTSGFETVINLQNDIDQAFRHLIFIGEHSQNSSYFQCFPQENAQIAPITTNPTIQSMVSYAEDYLIPPFEEWPFSIIQKTKRRFGILIYESPAQYNNARKEYPKICEHFIIGVMSHQEFSAKYPEITLMTPYFIVANIERTKFQVISDQINISETINTFLAIHNGTYANQDEPMYDINRIAPDIETKFKGNANHAFNVDSPRNQAQIALAVGVLILFIVGGIYLFEKFVLNSRSKIE